MKSFIILLILLIPNLLSAQQKEEVKQTSISIEPIWKYGIVGWAGSSGKTSNSNTPTIGRNGTIYITGQELHAVNPNGSLKWKLSNQFSDYPSISSDSILYLCGLNCLYAVNHDGTFLWKTFTGAVGYSPAIGSNGCIYVSGWRKLIAIYPNGDIKWEYETSGFIESSPSIGNDGTIYIGSNGFLHAINEDGTKKWDYETNSMVASSPAIGANGAICFGCDDNSVYSITKEGILNWKYETQKQVVSSPCIDENGNIYIGSLDSCLYALNQNGSFLWQYKTNGRIYSSPAIANNGNIYFGSMDSCFYALNSKGSLIWKYKTGRGISSSPVINKDGVVYTGSYDGYLYAFDESNGGLAESSWPCFGMSGSRAANLKPNSEFEVKPYKGISPLQVTLTNNSTGDITNYQWEFGDGNSSNEYEPTHVYQNKGNYTIQLTTSNNQTSDVKKRLIKVVGDNEILADFAVDKFEGKAPLFVNFTDISIGSIESWHWDFGDGSTSSEQNPNHSFSYTGTYKVTLTVSNFNTTSKSQIYVNVGPKWICESTGNVYSLPAIGSDGTVYINGGRSIALNHDGKEIWVNHQTYGRTATAISNDGTMYFGNYDGLIAMNMDGTVKWKFPTAEPVYSSPALGTDGTIFFGSNDHYVYALNKDGTLKWKYMTDGSVESSPAIGSDGTIFIGSCNYSNNNSDGALIALNSDGTLKWEYFTEGEILTSPAIDEEGTIYVGDYRGNLYAITHEGQLKWTIPIADEITTSPAIGQNGLLYFGSTDDIFGQKLFMLHIFNLDGQEEYGVIMNGSIYSTPVTAKDGTIYFGCSDGFFYAMDEFGAIGWKYGIGGAIGSPIIDDEGTVYVTSEFENIYAFPTNNGGLAESSWPCYRMGKNNVANVNYNTPNPPVAEFTTDTIIGYNPLTVHFSNHSSGNISDYLWDFGDGNTSTLSKPTHTYTKTGHYNIKLKASNTSQSDTESKFEYVHVLESNDVYADFSVDIRSGAGPLSVNFTDNSFGNIDSWNWSFGDGSTSLEQNPNHTYFEPGIYTATLIVSNSKYSDSLSTTIEVTEKWKFETSDGVFSTPAISKEGIIYFGSSDNFIYALNEDGTLKWKYETEGSVNSSPCIDSNGVIYVGSNDGFLYALNSDGVLNWKYESNGSIISSPAIGLDGSIYFGSFDNYLYALNSKGEFKWKYETDAEIFSSPSIGTDGAIYFGSLDKKVYALNNDGTLKWYYETNGKIHSSPALDINGTVYIGSEDNNLYAIDSKGEFIWSYKTKGAIISSPTIDNNGNIYFGSWDKNIYSISEEGKLNWSIELDGWASRIGNSSPTISANNNIFICNREGKLLVVNESGSLLWSYQTDGYIDASPVIYNQAVFIVSSDKYLHSIAIKDKSMLVSVWPSFGTDLQNTSNLQFKYPSVLGANFSATPLSGNYPLNVHFSDQSSGNIENWNWSFGDGVSSQEQNPSHIYTVEGTYSVTLTVSGAGVSNTETKNDYINVSVPAPVADFSADVTNGDKDLLVIFSDKSTGDVTSWSWNFGDGGTSTEQNPSHTYILGGTYTVSLSVNGAGGSDVETKTNYITVNIPTEALVIRNGEINIYPNPTTGLVQIDGLPQNDFLLINIYNVLGQKLKQVETKKQNVIIDLGEYEKGIYYLNFNGEIISTVKIIKE